MSESDIDMDRCLLGIDDEKACVPEITWTNCAEKMPPDDESMIICTYGNCFIDKMNGMIFHAAVKLSQKVNGDTDIKWVHYTEEKWEALNKCTGYQ